MPNKGERPSRTNIKAGRLSAVVSKVSSSTQSTVSVAHFTTIGIIDGSLSAPTRSFAVFGAMNHR